MSSDLAVLGATTPTNTCDFNGDGFSDLVLADPAASPDGATNAGAAYVIFGRNDQTTHVLLADLATPSNKGVCIDGIAGEKLGRAWSWAGDVNGDDRTDIVFAPHTASHNGLTNSGSTYCIYGKTTVTATLDRASNFTAGQDGFRVDGPRANQYLMPVLSPAGDVNSDGFDDFLVGSSMSSGADGLGDAYLIFGHATTAGIANWRDW